MSVPRTDAAHAHPHGGGLLARAGESLGQAHAAVVLLHGRGATAEGILRLADDLGAEGVAYLAPQATGNTWYPLSFLAPMEANEPGLSSALRWLGEVVEDIERAGIPARRIVLTGFSQGACLTLEYAARNARRYGGIVGFTGGLIGPPGTARAYAGDFAGTPVFLGASVPDPHVPWERVEETAVVLERMGATVDLRGYPGMPHTINADEIAAAGAIVRQVAEPGGEASS